MKYFILTLLLLAGNAHAAFRTSQQIDNKTLNEDASAVRIDITSVTTTIGVQISSPVQSQQDGAWDVNVSSDIPAFTKDVSIEGKTYDIDHLSATSAPDGLSFTGLGFSWAVFVNGGDATFNINGGNTLDALDGSPVSSSFERTTVDPTINLLTLDPGATVQIIIDGAN